MTRREQQLLEREMVCAVRDAFYPSHEFSDSGDPNDPPDVLLASDQETVAFEVTAAKPVVQSVNVDAAGREEFAELAAAREFKVIFDDRVAWRVDRRADRTRKREFRKRLEAASKSGARRLEMADVPGVLAVERADGIQCFGAHSESTIDYAVRRSIRAKSESIAKAVERGRIKPELYSELNLVIHRQPQMLADHSQIGDHDANVFLNTDPFWLGSFDRVFVVHAKSGSMGAHELRGRISDEDRLVLFEELNGHEITLALPVNGEVRGLRGVLQIGGDQDEPTWRSRLPIVSLAFRSVHMNPAPGLSDLDAKRAETRFAVFLQSDATRWVEVGFLKSFLPHVFGDGSLLLEVDISQ